MESLMSLEEARNVKTRLVIMADYLRTVRGHLGSGKWVMADRITENAQRVLEEFLNDLSKQHPHDL